MMKYTLKKGLSCLLAMAMIVTTFFAFGPSGWFPTAEAAIAPGIPALPDVYIVVPETLYLTPSLSASTTVQYYINNTVSGTTITPDEMRDAAIGKIWFNVSSGTVTDLKYSILGTNKTDVSMSAGSGAETLSGVTLHTGMTAASVRTLEWIFTCSINGTPAEYHAYSVAYAPYYTPVGAMTSAINSTGDDSQMQGMAWISGVHGFENCNPTTVESSGDNNNVSGDYHARTVWNGDWDRPLVPMITQVPAPTNNDENIHDWFSTTSDGACADATFTRYYTKQGGNIWDDVTLDTATRSHIAELTVDISRNRNFSTVPNVTTGFLVSDLKNTHTMGAFGGYIANYDGEVPGIDFWMSQNHYTDGGGSFTATAGVDTVFFGGNSDANTGTRNFYIYDETQNNNHNTIPYNGVWNRATPNTAGTKMHYIHAATCGEIKSDWINLNFYLFINVTAVNKSALRSKVFQKQTQANAKALDDYASVREKLEAAYLALGDPTATQAAIDSAAAGLDSIDGSFGNTKTIFAQDVNQMTGAQFPDSATQELAVVRADSAVAVTPNSHTGYSFTGMRRTYEPAGAYGMFDANAWAQSGCAANGSGVSAVIYDEASRSITVDNTGTQTNTAYPTGSVLNSGCYYMQIDPSGTYTIDFDYASAANGRIGVICYDQAGAFAACAWLTDSFKASGSTSAFRHHTEIFCPEANPYLFSNPKRYDIHYIVLTFGINAEGSQSAAEAVFCNMSVTPNNELFDFAQWNDLTSSFRSGTNAAGFAQKLYDSETKTLALSSIAQDTSTSYTTDNVRTAQESAGTQYYPWNHIPVDPGTTFSIEGTYAGTGNGQISVVHYNEDGAFTQVTRLAASSACGGILAATGSSTNFDPFYATFTARADDGYIALAFGGNFNADVSADHPVTNVFRDVKVHASTSANKYYTLYYHPNHFTVSFDAGGGAGTMPEQLFTYDVPQTLQTNTFVRPGYSFDGWATSAGGVTVYAENETVSNLTADSDGVVCLYACWTAKTYTIEYDEAGGSISGSYMTEYDINTSVTLPTAVKNGYMLTAWRADDGGQGNWGPLTYSAGIPVESGKYGNVKFTAVWRTNSYSVAFHANGGEGAAMANQNFVYGTSQTLTANVYSRTGYTFRGWALTSTAEEPLYLDKERVQDLTIENNAVVTLYAVWGANSYSIVYSTDGGTIGDTAYTSSFTVNDQINLPTTVEKSGYVFSGWKPANSAGTWNVSTVYSGTLNSGMTGNVTLQAQWTVQGYTITYALGGGAITGTRYTTAYDISSSIQLPSAQKNGYIFGGWQADGVGNWGDRVYLAGNVSAGRWGDVTLTAVWSGVQYFVRFNGNGSTGGVMYNQSFIYGESGMLNLNEYVRNGYGFLGWAMSDTATTAAYADGATVQNLSVTAGATITLYAVWEKSNYTITYDANGGEISRPGTTAYTITDTVTLPIVTRRGYSAQGWLPQQNSGSWHTWETYADAIAYGCYGDVTLVAQWEKNSYTITYDAAGGTMSGVYTTVYDVDTTIVLPSVTRAGYTFGGWSASAAWNNVIVTDTAPANAFGNVTLTALWIQKTYYVRFNANGGSGEMQDELMYFDVSQALTANAFTRNGYNFVGWATSENGSTAYADGDVVLNLSQTDGAIVYLYAKWSARNFTIAYNLNGAFGTLNETTVVMDGQSVTLRAYNPSETIIDDLPYTFVGWAYTKADADDGSAVYQNKDTFSLNEEVLARAEVNWTTTKPTITLYAVWKEAEIKLLAAEGSTTVMDTDRHFIYGLKEGITRSELENEYLRVVGNGRIVISNGAVGTGTVVELISNITNSVLETYEVIIFGDVNGDGMINTTDVTTLRKMNAGLLDSSLDNIYAFAGDLYADGMINTTDVTTLRKISTSLVTYDQAARTTK